MSKSQIWKENRNEASASSCLSGYGPDYSKVFLDSFMTLEAFQNRSFAFTCQTLSKDTLSLNTAFSGLYSTPLLMVRLEKFGNLVLLENVSDSLYVPLHNLITKLFNVV